MSSSTWTREELSASALALETVAWRTVEAQHRVSTMKLVDSLEEQAVLENLLDGTKPRVPADSAHLHYLLYSPFRYARSNPFPSRFRRAGSVDGVFYASASPETAIAEIVFYRYLFYAESPGTPLAGNPAEYTAFAAQLRADPALDLTRPPMSAHRQAWMDANDYTQCQSVADAARAEHMQAICYASVRDLQHRLNYAVLTPVAFASPVPVAFQSWRILLGPESALAKCEVPDIGMTFRRRDFAIESRLSLRARRSADA